MVGSNSNSKRASSSDSSRAPSYFSRFFEEQIRNSDGFDGSLKTLYIDRDPETFRDIARHLQGLGVRDQAVTDLTCIGYHVHPKDGQHYVKLFSDAQFYSRMSFLYLISSGTSIQAINVNQFLV